MQAGPVQTKNPDLLIKWKSGRIHAHALQKMSDYVILFLPPYSVPIHGKEVKSMNGVLSFVLSIAASVIAYYICKWIDKKTQGR